MEALNAGASVVAFASIALDGAGKLYEAVAAYRDGPQDVQLLLDVIDELRTILRRLKTFLRDPLMLLPADFALELRTSLKACETNLGTFSTSLTKCKANSQDGPLKWLISRLRPIICQTELEKMRLAILQHLALLSVQLEIVNGFRLAALGQTMQRVDKGIHKCLAFHRTHLQAQDRSLELIEASVQKLPDLIELQLEKLRRHVDGKIDEVPSRMHSSMLMRQTRLDCVAVAQNCSLASLSAIFSVAVEVWLEQFNMPQTDHFSRLAASCHMPTRTLGRRAWNTHSLPALQDLLRSAYDQATATTLCPNRQFQDILRAVDRADLLMLENKGTHPVHRGITGPGASGVLKSKAGNLVYWSRKSTLDHDLYGTISVFEAAISFTVRISAKALKISVFLSEDVMEDRTVRTYPVMQVSRMLPQSASIFSAIAAGDLSTVTRLIEDGEVLISDCDEKGNGLLNHALSSGHADVIRFLCSKKARLNGLESPMNSQAEQCIEEIDQPLSFWTCEAALSSLMAKCMDCRGPCTGCFCSDFSLLDSSAHADRYTTTMTNVFGKDAIRDLTTEARKQWRLVVGFTTALARSDQLAIASPSGSCLDSPDLGLQGYISELDDLDLD